MDMHATNPTASRKEMKELQLMRLLLQGSPAGEMSDAIRVRLPHSTVRELKQLEHAAHDRGFRHVTTSSILRASVDSFLGGVKETAPEIFGDQDEVPAKH